MGNPRLPWSPLRTKVCDSAKSRVPHPSRCFREGWDTQHFLEIAHPAAVDPTLRKTREGWGTRRGVALGAREEARVPTHALLHRMIEAPELDERGQPRHLEEIVGHQVEQRDGQQP